jgi:hypothetical protein
MNTFKKLSLIAAVALFAAVSAFGQATLSSTTTSAAVNACTLGQINTCQHTISLTSVSGILGPGQPTSTSEIGTPTGSSFYILMVDKEAMQVLSVNSAASTVTVARGYQGTVATAHVSGAKVWYGVPEYFWDATGGSGATGPSGACTASALRVLPAVVIPSGEVWNCGNGVWTKFSQGYGATSVGAAIASATTIAPTNPVFHVTGTTAVVNITVPPALPSGACLVAIPDGAFTTTTAGNIGHASTAVVGVAMQLCYDAGSAKFYPSY